MLERLIALLGRVLGWDTHIEPLPDVTTVLPAVPQRSVVPSLPPKPQPMTTFPQMIQKWAHAIETSEGAAPATNNPGNLKYSSLTASWGATPGRAASDGGHLCQFGTYAQGLHALCNFLVLGCENQLLAFHHARTLTSFTKIYAGNPPQGYIDRIVSTLGVSPDVDISTFLVS